MEMCGDIYAYMWRYGGVGMEMYGQVFGSVW